MNLGMYLPDMIHLMVTIKILPDKKNLPVLFAAEVSSGN